MRTIGFGFCVLALAASVQAQSAQTPGGSASAPVPRETREAVNAQAFSTASGANLSSTVNAAPVISLEGTQDDKTAKAQIGFQYGALAITVGATAKVGDGDAPTALADLNGLRNKTTGQFGLLWSRWRNGIAGDVNQILAPVCDHYAEVTGRTEGTDFKCRLGWFKRERTEAGRAAYEELIEKLTPGQIFFAGVNATIAPERFTFVGADDLTARPPETHTSWSAGGVAGVVFATNTVAAVSYTREAAFSPGDKAQVCSPVGSAGALKCTDQVVGAPGDPERTNRLSFELKQFFGTNFAVAPKINADATDGIVGIELPIYILQDKKGGLTGGVTLGWRSDTKAFTASAFVGPVLTLITRN
jgi:hypothetical protein